MRKRKISVHYLLPGLLLAVTLCLFAPIDLYLTTADELWFPLGELIPGLILFTAGVFLMVSLLAVLLPTKASIAFRAAIYAISFLLYVQGNLLVIDYGRLNGSEIQWFQYTKRYIADLALWIAVIALFIFLMFRLRKKIRRIVEIAACVLLITEVISIGVFLVQRGGRTETTENRYLSVRNEFALSSDRNTVVFVLDTLDSHLFENLWNKYPDLIREEFADFTFYPDTVGGATRTMYAIPFILTGDTNKEVQPYTEYLVKGYEASPLFRELGTGKYDTGFYSDGNYFDRNREDAIGNILSGTVRASSRVGLAGKFMQLVAIRYAPSIFARNFWMYTGDFEAYKSEAGEAAYALDDPRFYEDLTEKRLTVSSDKPVFRFYHLRGAHSPYTMNRECRMAGIGNSDEEEQTLGALHIVAEYLRQLREKNIYDNTTVFVMADHGFDEHSTVEQTPLFMLKAAGESHPFEVSDVPLYYGSMPEIFATAVKAEPFEAEEWRTDGTRLFYQHSVDGNLVNLTEYAVTGPAWEDRVEATGTVYHENSENLSRSYVLGTTVYFDGRDTARNYIVSGFAKNEGYYTWTNDRDAELLFELSEVPGSLEMILEHGSNGGQNVEVYVNEHQVAAYYSQNETKWKIDIPEGIVTGKEIRVRLCVPHLYTSIMDGAVRGISMKSLVIR